MISSGSPDWHLFKREFEGLSLICTAIVRNLYRNEVREVKVKLQIVVFGVVAACGLLAVY